MNPNNHSIITIGLFIAILTITTGMLSDRIDNVEAEISNRTEKIYSIPHLEADMMEMKSDIREIKNNLIDLKVIVVSSSSYPPPLPLPPQNTP